MILSPSAKSTTLLFSTQRHEMWSQLHHAHSGHSARKLQCRLPYVVRKHIHTTHHQRYKTINQIIRAEARYTFNKLTAIVVKQTLHGLIGLFGINEINVKKQRKDCKVSITLFSQMPEALSLSLPYHWKWLGNVALVQKWLDRVLLPYSCFRLYFLDRLKRKMHVGKKLTIVAQKWRS